MFTWVFLRFKIFEVNKRILYCIEYLSSHTHIIVYVVCMYLYTDDRVDTNIYIRESHFELIL